MTTADQLGDKRPHGIKRSTFVFGGIASVAALAVAARPDLAALANWLESLRTEETGKEANIRIFPLPVPDPTPFLDSLPQTLKPLRDTIIQGFPNLPPEQAGFRLDLTGITSGSVRVFNPLPSWQGKVDVIMSAALEGLPPTSHELWAQNYHQGATALNMVKRELSLAKGVRGKVLVPDPDKTLASVIDEAIQLERNSPDSPPTAALVMKPKFVKDAQTGSMVYQLIPTKIDLRLPPLYAESAAVAAEELLRYYQTSLDGNVSDVEVQTIGSASRGHVTTGSDIDTLFVFRGISAKQNFVETSKKLMYAEVNHPEILASLTEAMYIKKLRAADGGFRYQVPIVSHLILLQMEEAAAGITVANIHITELSPLH